MSWTTTPTSGISVSGWNYNYDSIRSSTTTSATFALHENGGANDIGSTHDIEFRIENGNLVLDVNPGTNSANPNAFTHQPPSGKSSRSIRAFFSVSASSKSHRVFFMTTLPKITRHFFFRCVNSQYFGLIQSSTRL